MHVTIEDAQDAIEAARAMAKKTKTKMCIAIVDSGANLKAFHRMDDAWVGSIDIAIKKAKTAVFFGMPTGPDRQALAARRPPLRHRALQRRPDHVSRRPAHRR